jgi:anti-sigma factor RsiW
MAEPAPAPMSCPEMVELLTDYLDGGLSEDDRGSFEAHLELCPGCVVYLDQFRETIAATGALREDDVAPEVMDELLAGFRDWKATRA